MSTPASSPPAQTFTPTAPVTTPASPPSSGILSSDLFLPAISLYPFLPCLVGVLTLASYLFILLLMRCWNARRFKTELLKETLLNKDLSNVLKGIASNRGDKTRSMLDVSVEGFQDEDANEIMGVGGFNADLNDVMKGIGGDAGHKNLPDVTVDLSPDEDGTETLGVEVFRAQVFSSRLHDLCRKFSTILASERRIISFLIPRWTWSRREYVMSLITAKKQPSKVVDEQSSIDQGSVFCVPVSIPFIRKRIQRSSSDPRLEGPQVLANICKDATFEGAQLAVVCKAVQIMQENLEGRWRMSFSIIRFTVANLLTIYAFWYTNVNTIEYLSAYIAGELVSSVYSQPLIDWLIPKLDQQIGNVVLMLKLHLEHEVSSGASREELPLTDWVRSYFRGFDEVKELLSICDQGVKARKGGFLRRAAKSLARMSLS